MGSAVLANRSGRTNPNPNPKKKQKIGNGAAGIGHTGRFYSNVDSPVVTQTTSDDACSFNQTSANRNASDYGGYLTFKVASYSKSEVLDLQKRLSGELRQIRDLQERIDSGRFSSTGNPRSCGKINKNSGNKRPNSAIYSAPNRAFNNGIGAVDFGPLLKECKQILGKLLRNKSAYIFKQPVDAVTLGLYDYHFIVKHPMDLGTVRSNLNKNLYPSPVEFASDVRLTFNNAMLYNPKNDPVHLSASQMLGRFEDYFRPVQRKIDDLVNQQSERDFQEFGGNDESHRQGAEEFQGNLWNNHRSSFVSPPKQKRAMLKEASPDQISQVPKMIEGMQMPMQAHQNRQLVQEQVYSPVGELPVFQVNEEKEVGKEFMKQRKPKANGGNKREMSLEEKQNLGFGLQNLPEEKMPQLMEILRKKDGPLATDEDEIELDIEALDTETLWELDQFVMNCKKFTSNCNSQNNESDGAGVAAPSTPVPEINMGALSDKNADLVKEFKDGDDDVDIDDDMQATSFPPVEIEKDEVDVGAGEGCITGQDHDHGERGNAASSSSSDSSSSGSSSSSDSGSSSGSDSADADDAQS